MRAGLVGQPGTRSIEYRRRLDPAKGQPPPVKVGHCACYAGIVANDSPSIPRWPMVIGWRLALIVNWRRRNRAIILPPRRWPVRFFNNATGQTENR